MKIEKSAALNPPTNITNLNVGDEFVYEETVYMKIAAVSGGHMRASSTSSDFNAVKLKDGTCFIFREHHTIHKVLSSKYTYSV